MTFKIAKCFVFLCCASSITGCALFFTSFQKVFVKDLYQIEIPNYLEKAKELNKEASLQYKNEAKELYLFIIDDLKASDSLENTNLKGYYEFAVSNLLKNQFKSTERSETKLLKINGLNALQGTLEAEIPNDKIKYLITIIESKTHFFHILSWTTQKTFSKYEKDLEHTINSFKYVYKK